VIFVDWRFVRSKVGRAVLSLKHSEAVAASYGINVTAYKVIAFILSGLLAGIGGGLFAFHSTNVVSNDFQFATAVLWVLMVVIGGLGNRTGVVIGSAFIALFPFLIELWGGLENFVEDTLNREPSYLPLVVGPALAVLTLVSFPGGIAEQISPITRWLRGERFSMHPEGHAPKKAKAHKRGALMAKLGIHRDGSATEPATEARTSRDDEPTVDASEEPGREDEQPVGSGATEKS
jgi:branched-chain amino acid transport system permease protein